MWGWHSCPPLPLPCPWQHLLPLHPLAQQLAECEELLT